MFFLLIINVFIAFFKIGLFSFGGGYVMLPLVEKDIVREAGWITYTQFVDIVAIAEMTPGPVAINLATFVGYTIGGIPGAIASTTGVVLPSLIIIILLAKFLRKFYETETLQAVFRGLRPAVIALIGVAFVLVARVSISFEDLRSIGIALVAFLILTFTRVNPLAVIIASGAAGFLLYHVLF